MSTNVSKKHETNDKVLYGTVGAGKHADSGQNTPLWKGIWSKQPHWHKENRYLT